jgi:hypothetical protein
VKKHRFILEPYKNIRSRHTCPGCNHKHKFTRYIEAINRRQIADHVGRCDRENNCGYHYTPKQFFADTPESQDHSQSWQSAKPAQTLNLPIDYLPFELFEKSVLKHEYCNLFPFLVKLFREEAAKGLCEKYFVGTNRIGNTVFWQRDIEGKIRQAKILQYDPATGRRNKETGASFAGKAILGNLAANLRQCFFGEYLLSFLENRNKPIAIVESEKTAVIASVYYPKFVWIATGGKAGCKWTEKQVCRILADRKVILFPDLGAYSNWVEKGRLLANVSGCKITISDILERYATEDERAAGLDIADYLLRVEDGSGLAMTDSNYPVIWDYKPYIP